MAPRRLLIILVILLGISTLLAVSVPERQAQDDEETTTEAPPTTTSEDEPAAKPQVEKGTPSTPFQADCERIDCITIDADAKPSEPVRLTVGRQVALRVTSDTDDVVEVSELGLVDAVSPDQPATFDLFVAPGLLDTQGGRYAVRLVDADRLIGRIEVVEAPDGKTATPPAREGSAKASGAQRP